jgi:8-oxo-dGTP pyrophosphatase MutT (NUDIX family)
MNWITQLKERLEQPLPGMEAQSKMLSKTMHKNGRASAPEEAITDAKKAAVMLLLFQKDGVWYTTLMQRPETPYPHSRQISFPGGGAESSDPSFEATALRETEEEFGIDASLISVVGALSPLYIPVSKYLVYPYIGYMSTPPVYNIQEDEVDEVIEVKITDLLADDTIKITHIETSSGLKLKDVPYFDVANKVVWGATAMMLHEFVTIAKELAPN